MPVHVLIVDLLGVILAFVGFTMAFRQSVIRRLFGRVPPRSSIGAADGEADPMTYILRIAGVMVMVFGIVIGGMVTLFNFA